MHECMNAVLRSRSSTKFLRSIPFSPSRQSHLSLPQPLVTAMHPPLAEHQHVQCAEVMRALKSCHTENGIAKFWGVCNDQKHALNLCLRGEVSGSCTNASLACAWDRGEDRSYSSRAGQKTVFSTVVRQLGLSRLRADESTDVSGDHF